LVIALARVEALDAGVGVWVTVALATVGVYKALYTRRAPVLYVTGGGLGCTAEVYP
jgi:hypothetical protein